MENNAKFDFKRYRFEDLEVWKIGMEIIHEVYRITRKFPQEELFALSNQLKRASVSIVLNIAEGSGQSTSKSFSLYLNYSKSSVLECVACIKIALQEKFILQSELNKINELLQKEYFKLIALAKSISHR